MSRNNNISIYKINIIFNLQKSIFENYIFIIIRKFLNIILKINILLLF